jgi:WD40 repeat protein
VFRVLLNTHGDRLFSASEDSNVGFITRAFLFPLFHTKSFISIKKLMILMIGQIRVWDATSTKQIAKFKDHSGPVYGLAVSQDGRWVVSGSEVGGAFVT